MDSGVADDDSGGVGDDASVSDTDMRVYTGENRAEVGRALTPEARSAP
jgi:hypothetical protein